MLLQVTTSKSHLLVEALQVSGLLAFQAQLRLYEGSSKALVRLYEGSSKALVRLYEGSSKALVRL